MIALAQHYLGIKKKAKVVKYFQLVIIRAHEHYAKKKLPLKRTR